MTALPRSGIITSVMLGLDPTGIKDCAPAIQNAIDNLTGPARFFFAPGLFRCGSPLLMGQYSPSIQGSGRDLTTLQNFPGCTNPIPVYGFRNIEQNSAQVTAANRPDCLGVLDRSFTSAPGYACGLRTCGNVYGVAMNHPIAIGSRSTAFSGVSWSYWSEDPGFTLELAITFNGTPTAGPIVGFGSSGSRPSPWFLSMVDATTMAFGFKTIDMPDDWSTGQHYFTFSIPPQAARPWKVRIWYDKATGTVGASISGIVCPLTWNGGPPQLAGLAFQRNRGQFALFLGTDQDAAGVSGVKVQDLTIWAMRFSNVARMIEPASDGARYLDDPHTIAYLPGSGPPARWLTVRAGQAGYNDVGALWLVPATPMYHGIPGGSVEDVTILDGSLLLGRVLNFSVRRCNLFGRYCGIHTIPAMEPSYPVILDDVVFSGWDAPVSLQKCEVWGDNLTFQSSGLTSYRAIGGNNRLRSVMVSGFLMPNAETCIELLPEQWGAMDAIEGLNLDNEASTFTHSVIRKELSPYTNSSLRCRDLNISQVAANQPLIDLVGHSWNPGTYNPGVIDVRVVGIYSAAHGPVVNAGVNWTGTVTATNLPAPIVTGVSAPVIKVESTTPISPQDPLMDATSPQDTKFPTFVRDLAKAPALPAGVMDTIETIFQDLQAKFGQINWLALIMVIAPDIASQNWAKLITDVVANIGKIWTTNPPTAQHVEAALRQHAMFQSA